MRAMLPSRLSPASVDNSSASTRQGTLQNRTPKQLDRGRPRATACARRARSLLPRWLSRSNCGGGSRPESSRKWRLRATARPKCECCNCKSEHAANWQDETAIPVPAWYVAHAPNRANPHASLRHIKRGRRPFPDHYQNNHLSGIVNRRGNRLRRRFL